MMRKIYDNITPEELGVRLRAYAKMLQGGLCNYNQLMFVKRQIIEMKLLIGGK
jgi:hypothetical protein